jgi:hypothetical protein
MIKVGTLALRSLKSLYAQSAWFLPFQICAILYMCIRNDREIDQTTLFLFLFLVPSFSNIVS